MARAQHPCYFCMPISGCSRDRRGRGMDGRTASDNCFYFITVGYFLDNSFVDKISRLF